MANQTASTMANQTASAMAHRTPSTVPASSPPVNACDSESWIDITISCLLQTSTLPPSSSSSSSTPIQNEMDMADAQVNVATDTETATEDEEFNETVRNGEADMGVCGCAFSDCKMCMPRVRPRGGFPGRASLASVGVGKNGPKAGSGCACVNAVRLQDPEGLLSRVLVRRAWALYHAACNAQDGETE